MPPPQNILPLHMQAKKSLKGNLKFLSRFSGDLLATEKQHVSRNKYPGINCESLKLMTPAH